VDLLVGGQRVQRVVHYLIGLQMLVGGVTDGVLQVAIDAVAEFQFEPLQHIHLLLVGLCNN